jgi:hypothetical protein
VLTLALLLRAPEETSMSEERVGGRLRIARVPNDFIRVAHEFTAVQKPMVVGGVILAALIANYCQVDVL